MRVLVLDFQMFPDRETIESAVRRLAADHEVKRLAPPRDAGDGEWDGVLAEIRHADLLVTL